MYALTAWVSIGCAIGTVAAFSAGRFVLGGLAAFGAVFFFFADGGNEDD